MAYFEDNAPDELDWARSVGPDTFRNLRLKVFLRQYCWVVYNSGFKYAIIKAKFPAIKAAFKDFEPERLARMRSIKNVLDVFDSERKARNYLDGAKAVIAEGFPKYKRRLAAEGVDMLMELPGIGPITKNHLAKNIGLADVEKDDRWLNRAAATCGGSAAELATYLSEQLEESRHTIDVAIWTLGKDGRLTSQAG